MKERKIYGLFNFSEYDKTAWINERDGIYKDLITGQEMEAAGVNVPAYGFFWLKKKLTDEETPGNRGLSLFPGVFGQKACNFSSKSPVAYG